MLENEVAHININIPVLYGVHQGPLLVIKEIQTESWL